MIASSVNPALEFYRGDEQLAVIGLVIGQKVRWGTRWRNADGDLTAESQAWLRQWLRSHGVDPSAAPLNWTK